MAAIMKLVRNPVKYLPRIRKVLLQHCTGLFQHTSFFLQGQMDIHPQARWTTSVVSETGGFSPPGERRTVLDLDAWDNVRRDMLALLLREILLHRVPGAFAELGVYKGLTARLFHHYAPERPLHLFDTFEGFTDRSDLEELRGVGWSAQSLSDTSLEAVRRFVAPQNNNVVFHKGFFPESVPSALQTETFAFVHLDADLYAPILDGLKFFYPRVARRGMIVVHDYSSWPGPYRAVNEFLRDKPEFAVPMPDKNGSVVIVKQQ
jgi:O-methyltransferase